MYDEMFLMKLMFTFISKTEVPVKLPNSIKGNRVLQIWDCSGMEVLFLGLYWDLCVFSSVLLAIDRMLV